MKFLQRLLREEKGSAMVLVTIAMVILLGSSALVIDYGQLVLIRRKLVNAADAAALAGAQELLSEPASPSNAMSTAEAYAIANGVDVDQVTAEVTHDKSQITVTVTGIVDYTFARVLGFEQGNVSAEAKAAVGSIQGMTGVAPLTIVEQSFVKGQSYELKSASPSEMGPGNFGVLALGGSGASRYEANLRDGYSGNIKIGDLLDTEPGNMSNPTKRACTDRINACNLGCTYQNFKPDCPLLVYIPVIKQPTGQGRQEVEVVGFAAFFLDKHQPPGQGNESSIKGWFVDTIVPGQINPGETGYGVSAVNLIK
ncbi:MAG TPA: pilus assembly protein TadG-related protein [Oscillospiraceae bacterium]|nr:pilus assembly protein TadG-related protein [Oscillospiraceae bacterium]